MFCFAVNGDVVVTYFHVFHLAANNRYAGFLCLSQKIGVKLNPADGVRGFPFSVKPYRKTAGVEVVAGYFPLYQMPGKWDSEFVFNNAHNRWGKDSGAFVVVDAAFKVFWFV